MADDFREFQADAGSMTVKRDAVVAVWELPKPQTGGLKTGICVAGTGYSLKDDYATVRDWAFPPGPAPLTPDEIKRLGHGRPHG